MARYYKFIVALAGAAGVGTSLTVDGSLSLNDGFALASALLGALAVYAVPNKPPGTP